MTTPLTEAEAGLMALQDRFRAEASTHLCAAITGLQTAVEILQVAPDDTATMQAMVVLHLRLVPYARDTRRTESWVYGAHPQTAHLDGEQYRCVGPALNGNAAHPSQWGA